MSFLKTGACPKCGAPIWSPDPSPFPGLPPAIIYSCECLATYKEEIGELRKKIEALEAELKELKPVNKRKRTLLTD